MFGRKKFSFVSLIGLVISLTCITFAICLSGAIDSFFDLKALLITGGGTLGVFIFSFPPDTLKTFGSVFRKAFSKEEYNLDKDVEVLVSLSEISKKQGLLNLEKVVDQYTNDAFLKKGILNIIDNKDIEQLKETMETEMYFMHQRHTKGRAMFEMIASTAPSLGLIGTYIGLIPMLVSLDDPSNLGPLMAVQMLTSFYGAFIAYIFFTPIAKRLQIMDESEIAQKELIIEGLLGIKEGRNPRMLKEELTNFIAKTKQKHGKNSNKRASFRSDFQKSA